MDEHGTQVAYWDGVGATKTFTHPVNHAWLAELNRDARILDYGCGYGRVMAELSEHGFTDVRGVDPSPALIDRGRRSRPDLRFDVMERPPALAYEAASFDVILLFAVLTCVPEDDARRALIDEVVRVLRPGGLLYVSDVPLQDDERSRDRYEAHAARSGTPYGVFATDDGAACRHHERSNLRALLSGFDVLQEREFDVASMNGHQSRAVQLLARRR
ncbi:class I SAM-dependent methyltransferase [Phytoactinopolyspora halotolerans]|uniref:Class I SAM-dependent methyltransferase n=1 Tax=Phytoactinopolyspora halotolerans TaxID=1981512 RepID=A0A6L9SFR1_9ACTN|nr:class I SAM-dependent methyltransferase [Phytoactinopolyspora halotolerans]NEE03943.1 class I SAM-dependent methyltransferase [Phytoactinopolyspora halotolerans]